MLFWQQYFAHAISWSPRFSSLLLLLWLSRRPLLYGSSPRMLWHIRVDPAWTLPSLKRIRLVAFRAHREELPFFIFQPASFAQPLSAFSELRVCSKLPTRQSLNQDQKRSSSSQTLFCRICLHHWHHWSLSVSPSSDCYWLCCRFGWLQQWN